MKFPSQYLIFEITESTYIHNIEAVNHMIRFFHEKNIRISMDDFGSGYSSLNTLKDILFDEVKIDKKFLSDKLTENGKNRATGDFPSVEKGLISLLYVKVWKPKKW